VSLVEKAIRKMQLAQSAAVTSTPASAVAEPFVGEPLPVLRHAATAAVAPGHRRTAIRIDFEALRGVGLVPPVAQERELADQYRAIKRPLLKVAVGADAVADGKARLIMLTSALPNDGKTFTCINLALSLALEKDISVLLVDADVAKPHISRVLGVQNEPGLLDVLADPRSTPESAILPTDIPQLSFLPAGRRSETATELLGSDRMTEVLAQLADADRRRIVLFDSSPVLLTSEAKALAAHVGHVVFVVSAGITPQQALKDAVDIVGSGPRVSLVLNQADLSGPLGYYYGHRYGYGQHDPA
jgi:protein-tyrosine kinase